MGFDPVTYSIRKIFHLDFILPLDVCHTELKISPLLKLFKLSIIQQNKACDSLLMRIKIVKSCRALGIYWIGTLLNDFTSMKSVNPQTSLLR